MELFLLRHGSAAPVRTGEQDADRSLTEEGRQEVRRVIAAARLANVCPSLLTSSPYQRALESASIAATILDCKEPVLTSDALRPEADVRDAWNEVRVHRDEPSILLIGHNPLFSMFGAYLLGVPEMQVDFPQSGVMRVDVENFGVAPRGVLKWLVTPRLVV